MAGRSLRMPRWKYKSVRDCRDMSGSALSVEDVVAAAVLEAVSVW